MIVIMIAFCRSCRHSLCVFDSYKVRDCFLDRSRVKFEVEAFLK